MKASTIPIGHELVVADTDYIKGTFRRVSENEGILEEFDPPTGKLVLKMKVDIHHGTSAVEYVDQGFWTITIDGKAFTPGAEPACGDVDFDAKSRRVKITTR